jgi:hypothetical protein
VATGAVWVALRGRSHSPATPPTWSAVTTAARGTGSDRRASASSQRRWKAMEKRGENTGLIKACSDLRCRPASSFSSQPWGVNSSIEAPSSNGWAV